jgi:creatinine amidohydrolase
MLKRYERVAYELLRPEQVAALRKKTPIAYVPAGSLEWHSFQNPLGCDALKAHAVCCEAALRHGGIVLPPVYQGLLGKGWGPKGWEDYTLGYNTQRTFEALILGIASALVAADWRVIVGVTGHDVPEQRLGLARSIARATKGRRATGFAVMEGDLQKPGHGLPFWMDHAGAWETSCMLYACPGKVNLGDFRRHRVTRGDDLDIRGPEGIGGKDPAKYASALLGRRIVGKMGDLIGRRARGMLKGLRT